MPAGANMNISADPLFAGGNDFHLSDGSPAIDAGTTNSAPATDSEGRARLGPPDMGCFELLGPVLAPFSLPAVGGVGVVITGGRD